MKIKSIKSKNIFTGETKTETFEETNKPKVKKKISYDDYHHRRTMLMTRGGYSFEVAEEKLSANFEIKENDN